VKAPPFIALTWGIIKETFYSWNKHNVPRLSASLSYYTAFSIAPLLILTVSLAGLIFGGAAAEGKIVAELSSLMGGQSALALQTMLRNSQKASVAATLIGAAVLLVGASGVMVELKDALNLIWNVKGKTGFRAFLKDRLLSIGMMLAIGFLLLVSLVVSTALTVLGAYFKSALPVPGSLLQFVNFVLSVGVTMLLFATIFKALPDADIEWHDVWTGAAITSFLFSIGKYVLGVYLGRGVIGSAYGAAGSVLVMLLWVYYSAQVLYFGAEFTKIFADRFGSGIRPILTGAHASVPVKA
jgi:membrane protein